MPFTHLLRETTQVEWRTQTDVETNIAGVNPGESHLLIGCVNSGQVS